MDLYMVIGYPLKGQPSGSNTQALADVFGFDNPSLGSYHTGQCTAPIHMV